MNPNLKPVPTSMHEFRLNELGAGGFRTLEVSRDELADQFRILHEAWRKRQDPEEIKKITELRYSVARGETLPPVPLDELGRLQGRGLLAIAHWFFTQGKITAQICPIQVVKFP